MSSLMNKDVLIVGITGGIGSGKSVVSRILRLKGHKVYDCDFEARSLMDESEDIKRRIARDISEDTLCTDSDGVTRIDRRALADIVFADENARLRLNGIVHESVREDVRRRASECGGVFFVESAILAESHLAEICDRIWLIKASESESDRETRIGRVMLRDGCTRERAEARIVSQLREEEMIKEYSYKTEVIDNSGAAELLPQIEVATEEVSGGLGIVE